jgi:iron complex transport system substrate-binding protein
MEAHPLVAALTSRRTLLALIVLALLLAACGGGQQQTNGEEASPTATAEEDATATEAASEAAAETEPAGVSFTDGEGVTVEFDQPITDIVCLTGACVDILVELGLEPAGVLGPRLVTAEDYYGAAGEQIPAIPGSFTEPDLEAIAALDPDLVIGLAGFQSQGRERLETVAPFVAMSAASPQTVYDNLRGIGALTGTEDAAEEAVAATEEKIAAYAERSPRDVTVLHMVGFGTEFSISPQGSLYGSVLSEVFDYPWQVPSGAEADVTGNVPYSLEEILAVNPEWLFVADLDAAFGGGPFTAQFADNPVWNQIAAVQQNQVELVDTGIWINYRGTRALRLMLDQAMPLVYPEVFPQPLPG